MIYLDTSVALAHLLAEDRSPPAALWDEALISGRLLEYELWVRINAMDLARTHGEAVKELLGRVALIDLAPHVLARAIEPFPVPVRTLDAIHLSVLAFVRSGGLGAELASYDDRQVKAARALGLPVSDLVAN